MNILLCEADPAWREELYKVFRKRGWRVTTSHESTAILHLLSTYKYDAIVCNRAVLPGKETALPAKLVVLSEQETREYPCVILLSEDAFQSAKKAAVFLAK